MSLVSKTEGGRLNIINATKSSLKKSGDHHWRYQMPTWDESFDDVISSMSQKSVYIEFDVTPFKDKKDDKGQICYYLEDWSDLKKSIIITAHRFDGNFTIDVKYNNFKINKKVIAEKNIRLGWVHNGSVTLIIGETDEEHFFMSGYDGRNWMQDHFKFLMEKKLNELCIPGSHDSGMSFFGRSTLGGKVNNTITQSLSVGEQLELGTRYFDLRPVLHNSKLHTGHYSNIFNISWEGAHGESFDTIIGDINKFTKESNELIILDISHAYSIDRGYDDFNQTEWNILLEELKKINNLYKTKNKNLQEMQLKDFIYNSKTEKQLAAVIILTPGGALNLGADEGEGFYSKDNFMIFDQYSKTNDLETMSKDQLNKLKENRKEKENKKEEENKKEKKKYFLLSWTLTQSDFESFGATASIGTASILELAREANQELYRRLFENISKECYPNIIYIDDVSGHNIAAGAMMVNCAASLKNS